MSQRARRRIQIVLGGLALVLAGTAALADDTDARGPAGSPVAEMAAGDQAYRLRADPAQAESALKHYRAAYARTPNDPAAGWRVGMGAYFMGMRVATARALKQKYWAEGRDAALHASDLDPKCAPCHFWAAINMALYGESVGVLKMLFTLRAVRGHLDRSIELDPSYMYCGAYRVQAGIERRLPGILGGSKKESRQFFEQAIKTCPGEPLNYLGLAELLERDLHDRDGAIAAAQNGLKVPMPTKERLESLDALPGLQNLLARLGATP
jgi:hypothetical protein